MEVPVSASMRLDVIVVCGTELNVVPGIVNTQRLDKLIYELHRWFFADLYLQVLWE